MFCLYMCKNGAITSVRSFYGMLKCQHVETQFILLAGVRLILNNYDLKDLQHMAQETKMRVSQADTALAMWKGVWQTELYMLTVQLLG